MSASAQLGPCNPARHTCSRKLGCASIYLAVGGVAWGNRVCSAGNEVPFVCPCGWCLRLHPPHQCSLVAGRPHPPTAPSNCQDSP